MKCMSWSSRSASTRTVEAPLACAPAPPPAAGGGRGGGRRPRRWPSRRPPRPARPRRLDGGLRRAATSGTEPASAASASSGSSVASQTSISRARRRPRRAPAWARRRRCSPCSASAREDHVGAHGGHLRVVGELRADVHDALAGGQRREVGATARGEPGGRRPGSAVRSRTRSRRLGDQRLGDDALGAGRLDRVDGLAERVEAAAAARRSPRARARPCAGAAARRRPPSRA